MRPAEAKSPTLDAAHVRDLTDSDEKEVGGQFDGPVIGEGNHDALQTIAAQQLDDLAAGDDLEPRFRHALP